MAGVDRIHLCKIGHIGQKHCYFHNMAEIPVNSFEDLLKIRKDARRLSGHIPFDEFPCVWVLRHLAREIESRSRVHQMREWSHWWGEFWAVDSLSLHRIPPMIALTARQQMLLRKRCHIPIAPARGRNDTEQQKNANYMRSIRCLRSRLHFSYAVTKGKVISTLSLFGE